MLRHLRARHSRWPAVAVLACIVANPVGAAEPAALDLARYLGRWYVIAQAPAAPRMVGAYFEYLPRADGAILHRYAERPAFAREPVFVERSARPDPQHPARWRVSRGWFGSTERWILYVSPDYRFALAGAPDRKTGWILARDPVIPEWSYAGLLARLALHGYDVARFHRVVQKPEQAGLPGFE